MVENGLFQIQNYKYCIPKNLTNIIPKRDIGYNITNRNKSFFNCKTESFKNPFFPYTIEAWYSLDPSIIESYLLEVFQSKLLGFIQPGQRSPYNASNPQSLKFLTRLAMVSSHLNEHFKECINPLCPCNLEIENTLYFFQHCQHYSTFCMGLINKVNKIYENFSYLSDNNKVSLLLYGESRFDDNKNNLLLSASITYILETSDFRLASFNVVCEFQLNFKSGFHLQ